MSGANKKRPAEASNQGMSSKRTTTRKATDTDFIEEESDELCHITAKLHSKFVVFPELLRERLQRMYQSMVRCQMTALLAGTTYRCKYTYNIVTERRVRQTAPNAEHNVTLCKENIVSLSIANAMVLDIFLKAQKDALTKPKFIMLETQKGLVNHDFIQLHAVRHGEIGWGFDTNGCLSLYLVSIDGGKLKEYVIYVQRADIKVEEQA